MIIATLSCALTWIVRLLKLKTPIKNENLSWAVCTNVFWQSLIRVIQEWKFDLSCLVLSTLDSLSVKCHRLMTVLSLGKAWVWLTFSSSLKGIHNHMETPQKRKMEDKGCNKLGWSSKTRSTSKSYHSFKNRSTNQFAKIGLRSMILISDHNDAHWD